MVGCRSLFPIFNTQSPMVGGEDANAEETGDGLYLLEIGGDMIRVRQKE